MSAPDQARLDVSAQLYERCLELAKGSKLAARMLFERACELALQAEHRRLAAQARANRSRMLDPRRHHGMAWR